MSLIICRNRPDESDVVGENSSIYEPYSFRNQLTSNVEIPANAQIALQSVKVNMDGSVILGDDAKIFYMYFGPEVVGGTAALPSGTIRNIEDSPFTPIQVSLFPNRDRLTKISIQDVATEIARAVNQKMTNPNMKHRFDCTVELNANGSLKGFRFEMFESTTGGAAAYAPTNTIPPAFAYANGQMGMLEASFTANRLYQLTNGAEGQAPPWTYQVLGAPFNLGEFSINGIRRRSRSIVGNVPPLNLKGGKARFNISGALNGVHSARQMVGLTRPCRGSYVLPRGRVMNQPRIRPPWYRHGNGSVAKAWMSAFFDYAVAFDHTTSSGANYMNRLQILHTVTNIEDLGGFNGANPDNIDRLKPQRLVYGDGTGGSEDTGTSAAVVASAGWSNDYGYDLGTNPLSIEFIEFEVKMCQVLVRMISDTASGSNVYELVTYSSLRDQKDLLKPINQNCEVLLPLMLLNNADNAAPAGATQDMGMIRWDGNNVNFPTYNMLSDDENNNGFMDRIYSSDLSTAARAKALDQNRDYNNYSPTYLAAAGASPIKPYPGLAADPTLYFSDIKHFWSVLPNELYGGLNSMYVSKANTSILLGYPNIPIIHTWTLDAEGDRYTDSFSVPNILPSRSIFVRLENFGNESVNAFQGIKSKIIAHLPRFDGTNSVGPLYLEPNNLIYIDLKNPQPFRINSFDISLCYADETYATALQGTTIVCLHLREKP